ncbi:MAG: PqqD family protein [Actinomycetota bacterium]
MAIRRADGVSYEPSGDSVVILDAEGSVMTTLNEVGTLIWNELADRAEVPGIVEQLAQRYPDVAESELTADVEAFIASLAAADLVVVD